MAQSMKDRAELTIQYMNNPDVTFKEASLHTYYWLRMELAILKRQRQYEKYEKFRALLNDDQKVLRFRKEMQDL